MEKQLQKNPKPPLHCPPDSPSTGLHSVLNCRSCSSDKAEAHLRHQLSWVCNRGLKGDAPTQFHLHIKEWLFLR